MSYTATRLEERFNLEIPLDRKPGVLVGEMIMEPAIVEEAVVRDIVLVQQFFEDYGGVARGGCVDETGLDGEGYSGCHVVRNGRCRGGGRQRGPRVHFC